MFVKPAKKASSVGYGLGCALQIYPLCQAGPGQIAGFSGRAKFISKTVVLRCPKPVKKLKNSGRARKPVLQFCQIRYFSGRVGLMLISSNVRVCMRVRERGIGGTYLLFQLTGETLQCLNLCLFISNRRLRRGCWHWCAVQFIQQAQNPWFTNSYSLLAIRNSFFRPGANL